MASLEKTLRLYNAEVGEWPLLFVLDAHHPARLRLLLAAEAAQREGSPRASQYFLSQVERASESQQLIIDDYTEVPPSEDDSRYRRFLRAWLRGDTTSFARFYGDSHGDRADRDLIVHAICYSRHRDLIRPPQRPIADIDQLLGRHAKGVRMLASTIHNPNPRFDELLGALDGSEASSRLRFALAKHVADVARYHGHPRQAIDFYTEAQVRLIGLSEVPDYTALKAVLLAGKAAAISEARSSGDAVEFLESERAKFLHYSARIHFNNVLWFHRFQASLSSRDYEYSPVPPPETVREHDPLYCLRDYYTATASILSTDEESSQIQLDEAIATAVAAGSSQVAKRSIFSRAILRLLRQPAEVDEAALDLVRSAGCGESPARSLKRLPQQARSALCTLSPEGLQKAHEAVGQLHGERVHRAAMLARMLETVAESETLEKDQVSAFVPILVELARESAPQVPSSNIDAISPSMKAMKALAMRRPGWLHDSIDEDTIVAVLCARVANGPWLSQEAAIDATEHLATFLSQRSLRTIVQTVLEHLEPIDAKRSFWPISRTAFSLLGAKPVAEAIQRDRSLARRVKKQVYKFCFGPIPEDGPSVEQSMALWLSMSLGLKPPDQIRDIVAAKLDIVQEGSISTAPGHALDLVHSIELLTDEEVVRTVEVVGDLVEKRRIDLHGSAVDSSGIATVVFELTTSLYKHNLLVRETVLSAANALHSRVLSFINDATLHPILLSPARFDPAEETPQPRIAFIWGYAVQSLAAALGKAPQARHLVQRIVENDALHPKIRRGFVRSFSEFRAFGPERFFEIGENTPPTVEEIRQIPDNWYHELIPGWVSSLVAIQGPPTDVVDALVTRSIALGPHMTDIAVFTLASRKVTSFTVLDERMLLRQYRRRLHLADFDWSVYTLISDLLARLQKPPVRSQPATEQESP